MQNYCAARKWKRLPQGDCPAYSLMKGPSLRGTSQKTSCVERIVPGNSSTVCITTVAIANDFRGVFTWENSARVSYPDDFLISYRVYMVTWSIWRYTSCWLKYMRGSKSQTILARRALSLPYSSLPADRFDTETSGRFAFTWFRCEISYRSEFSPRWLVPERHFVVVAWASLGSDLRLMRR